MAIVTHPKVATAADDPTAEVNKDEWNAAHNVSGIVNADIDAAAGIVESKLALSYSTHSNANDPSASEKLALPGTSGTPSGTNKYVTDIDSRMTDARTPTSHGHAESDVTNLITDLAAKVAKSLYDAYTILVATEDNTPIALTVGEQSIVGRKTGGAIAALTAAEVKTLLAIAEGDVTNLTTDLAAKIAKTTNITALNETGIADGEIAVFNLTNKDIRTSDKTIVTTLGTDDTTVPTSKAVKDVTDTKAATTQALDTFGACTDITTRDASTSAHGLVVKPVAPASGLLNVIGIGNGETVLSNKAMFDLTNPAMDGTAAPGTQVIAGRRDHVHPSDTSRAADNAVFHTATVGEINGLTVKATPIGADLLLIEDSEASFAKKKVAISTMPGGGGGEANTASNLGTGADGEGLFTTKTGVDLPFKRIKAGSNITLTSETNDVLIEAASGAMINRAPSANLTVPNGYGLIVPKNYEIVSGYTLEIGATGVMEIT